MGLSGCADPAVEALRAAVDDPQRPEADRARDQYRHPFETLSFFGVRPEHTVVELWPGGGWYSRILAPYVNSGEVKGALFAVHFPAEDASEYQNKSYEKYRAGITEDPLLEGIYLSRLSKNPDTDICKAGTADVVLTFRNLHNWHAGGYLIDIYQKAYKCLKNGGIFGVVEHRKAGATNEEMAKTGYMEPLVVKSQIELAGFTFVGESEINANPNDTADHPEGVWTLPPTFRLGDVDREKYAAIGESDRFTMKFVKR
ncbi:MAG: class I SAM-dependent methyltransferase [Gammaproteobacteria bacterium AqS3]|nr:class I SAM-dependent methyltransferase [Gammaproteobacteria bacterium AqS3]